MKKKLLLVTCASFVSLFSVTACDFGSGWEAIEYEGVPYTEERTAGRGVKFVLASMAPRKGPVLEPITDTAPMVMPQTQAAPPQISMPPEPEPEIKNATPIFNEKMGKSK